MVNKRSQLNLIIIMSIIIALILTGCTQNENKISALNVEEKSLIGTWANSTKIQGQTVTITYSFLQNRTYTVTAENSQGRVSYSGTWRAENNKLFVNIEGKSQTGSYKILDDNKTLVITDINTGNDTILIKQ
jgi:hypothetical protein